jgi:hypothetical protein
MEIHFFQSFNPRKLKEPWKRKKPERAAAFAFFSPDPIFNAILKWTNTELLAK